MVSTSGDVSANDNGASAIAVRDELSRQNDVQIKKTIDKHAARVGIGMAGIGRRGHAWLCK